MRIPRVGPWLILLVLLPHPASADFIDLTKVSIGPSNTLVFKGVTFSAGDSQVSMVAGVGVGVGSDGSVDRQSMYDYDQTDTNFSLFDYTEVDIADARMSLSVNGRINSLTLQPYMIVDGPASIDGVPLHFRVRGELADFDTTKADGVVALWIESPFAPLTIDFTRFHTDTKDLRPYEISNFGAYLYGQDDVYMFYEYLLSHNFPDVAFSYGFSITSLDYEHGVPEPATLSLLLMGSGGAWLWRRRNRLG